jgi:Bifunctional DNA primase/polymerase, N-terminal
MELVSAMGHELPRTLQVRTPTSGRHVYFAAPATPPLGNTAGQIGENIDTRGIGGYVVAAGSARPEGHYSIIERAPVAPLPDWLIDRLTSPRYVDREGQSTVPEHINRYEQAILKDEARPVANAVPGTRNNALNTAAFSLGQLVAGNAITMGLAWEVLCGAARRHIGTHGFTEAEINPTIRSGLRAGTRYPRRLH